MTSPRHFRFSLSDLFLATALIAVGTAGVVWAAQHERQVSQVTVGSLLVASAAIIGAGLGALFHRKLLGLNLGIIAFAIIAVGISYFSGVPPKSAPQPPPPATQH